MATFCSHKGGLQDLFLVAAAFCLPRLWRGGGRLSRSRQRGSLASGTLSSDANHRTLIPPVWVTLCPAASSAVNVYVVVLTGFTSTHRLYDGHTGLSCGSSFTTFALATP